MTTYAELETPPAQRAVQHAPQLAVSHASQQVTPSPKPIESSPAGSHPSPSMTREKWIAQALEDAPPITAEQSATLADLLADARR